MRNLAEGCKYSISSSPPKRIDEAHPGLADDLAQEIPDHAKVRKEQPIAEIGLSQENLSSEEAYQQRVLVPRARTPPLGWGPHRNFHSQACQNPAL
jgi:hypothetical protein